MFLGGAFLMRQVSINILWWLALAKIMRADLSLFPLASMKEKPSFSCLVGVGFGLGLVSCTVLRIVRGSRGRRSISV